MTYAPWIDYVKGAVGADVCITSTKITDQELLSDPYVSCDAQISGTNTFAR